MAKGFFFLSLLLSLAFLINARVSTLLPEKSEEAAQASLVEFEPKLLLPSEKPESESEPVTRPAEPLTLRGPIPTEEDDLFAGNRHQVYQVYIRRPFLFRFPRRFHHHKHEHEHEHEHDDADYDDHDDDRYKHHHHDQFMGGGLHFFPEREGEIEVPIRGAEFEDRFLDENHFPAWFRGHDHHHHRTQHDHRFFPDGLKEMKRKHKHKHEEEDDDDKPKKGGVLKWFGNLLNMP